MTHSRPKYFEHACNKLENGRRRETLKLRMYALVVLREEKEYSPGAKPGEVLHELESLVQTMFEDTNLIKYFLNYVMYLISIRLEHSFCISLEAINLLSLKRIMKNLYKIIKQNPDEFSAQELYYVIRICFSVRSAQFVEHRGLAPPGTRLLSVLEENINSEEEALSQFTEQFFKPIKTSTKGITFSNPFSSKSKKDVPLETSAQLIGLPDFLFEAGVREDVGLKVIRRCLICFESSNSGGEDPQTEYRRKLQLERDEQFRNSAILKELLRAAAVNPSVGSESFDQSTMLSEFPDLYQEEKPNLKSFQTIKAISDTDEKFILPAVPIGEQLLNKLVTCVDTAIEAIQAKAVKLMTNMSSVSEDFSETIDGQPGHISDSLNISQELEAQSKWKQAFQEETRHMQLKGSVSHVDR